MATGTVNLLGRDFTVAEQVGLMALLRFAHFAKNGASTDDMDALAAIYDVLQQCVADEEWDAFQQHAMDVRASTEELLDSVKEAMSVISARPTESPSDSSDGRTNTGTDSSESSFSLAFSTGEELTASPLLGDPRVVELVPVREAGRLLRAV